jgi:flavin reductase (DIM6/NTAB) family NADH-FMN oxidoreductase RutF
MLKLNTSDLSPVEIQSVLNSAVAPRPVCFASTIDKEGNVNLSPFSYFNLFSVNPPTCVFSPSRRVRDNTTKHTLENIREVAECVINIVNYNMVQQVSLASVEYPKGVNEFIKAGFTMLPSEMVRPPRVAESPVQLECVVKDIAHLGHGAGAGNLVIAEVKLIHISETVLGDNGKIDQRKMDHVARLGGDWYCRVTGDNLFEVAKPVRTVGIGVDAIPFAIRNSKVLTGNNLGQLGNVEILPSAEEIELYKSSFEIADLLNSDDAEMQIHLKAKQLLDECKVMDAWKVLLAKVEP